MSADPQRAGHYPELDTSRPSVARVYDCTLGGKDNFAVDRAALDRAMETFPVARVMARINRRWLVRVVGYLADRVGLDQFLDLGSGLPTVENTHEVAQRYQPEATVVYLDNDPAVNAYGRALLAGTEGTFFATADLTQPEDVFAAPEVQRLDFTRPVALIQCSTLHHVADETGPEELMRRYVDALPSGSYVAVSHLWDPCDNGPLSHLARTYQQAITAAVQSGWWRSAERIRGMLPGVELLEPGLVPLDDWWPSGPRVAEPQQGEHLCLGGVGRKR